MNLSTVIDAVGYVFDSHLDAVDLDTNLTCSFISILLCIGLTAELFRIELASFDC
uniref:Uncharacterized protein n=1 Tax=Candidatus Kentrum sp. SD TaxID=2126332 RepID=A0A450Z774_9GAMM|nr:MAG: hypothetical protein BECKSD772F_GA0070984_11262 [Candidatus Kentron sp. SD]VFK49661.1 MAG: hypothetical protein BECKSD772E_GA0070983_12114 [Candidatus Kentron sp. SD]